MPRNAPLNTASRASVWYRSAPASFATDMGNLEAKDGGMLIPFSAEERMGKPEELGYALATVADERNDYLAGVDVLVDGGSTNGMKEFKKKK